MNYNEYDEYDIISEPKVLKSGAGWYIGRTFSNPMTEEFDFPYDRLSLCYFKTKEKAEKHLAKYFGVYYPEE